jgi:hypothetical protein
VSGKAGSALLPERIAWPESSISTSPPVIAPLRSDAPSIMLPCIGIAPD